MGTKLVEDGTKLLKIPQIILEVLYGILWKQGQIYQELNLQQLQLKEGLIFLDLAYMPEINNNNYNIWSKQLSQAWSNQDLFKYRRYQNGGNYNNVNTALFSKYKPTGKDQHRDDRVKLINHPTHPKRGRFTKDGMKFYMSDFGMNNPNLTLFGAPDNYPDGQTTMIYKGGVVLPEITVTPTQRYIDNPYDQFKIYLKK